MLFLTELIKDWPCTVNGGELRTVVTGITEDSSRVKKGCVFVARKGNQSDGAMYIKKAIEQGAAAIVIDRTNLTEIPARCCCHYRFGLHKVHVPCKCAISW